MNETVLTVTRLAFYRGGRRVAEGILIGNGRTPDVRLWRMGRLVGPVRGLPRRARAFCGNGRTMELRFAENRFLIGTPSEEKGGRKRPLAR